MEKLFIACNNWTPTLHNSRMWADVLSDINQADHVLVNSDYLKSMFIEQGWKASRIHVQYLGVDDAFINAIIPHVSAPLDAPLRLIYAGGFIDSKGAQVLIRALEQIANLNWTLDIAGAISPAIEKNHPDFFNNSKVRIHGVISRNSLASMLSQSEILVLPSFSEGSARVVFEALACGCYAIVTQNCGSVVADGCHGAVVPVNSPDAIADAIIWAANNRDKVCNIGMFNQQLVRKFYTQRNYGNGLASLYDSMI
jgi:glycosyltransferase involved in cell wall biosynthesis